MTYNIDFELIALMFLSLLLIFSSVDRQVYMYQSKMYRPYILLSFADLCLDIATCFGIELYDTIPLWINYVINAVFLSIQFIIPNIFMQYVYYRIQRTMEKRRQFPLALLIPAYVGVLLAITSPATGFIFYFDQTGYRHGLLHFLLYLNSAGYTAAGLWYVIRNKKNLKKRQQYELCGVILVAIAPSVVEFFVPEYMLSNVGTAFAAFVMYLTSENAASYLDSITVALNRKAFSIYVSDCFLAGVDQKIFTIAMDNFKIVNELYGIEGGNELMRFMVDSLRKSYGDSRVFRLGGDIFAVAADEKDDTDQVLAQIKEAVTKTYWLGNVDVRMSACISLIHTRDYDKEDLMGAIEYSVKQVKLTGKGRFLEVGNEVVNVIDRRRAIEQALVNAVKSGTFEVHYQPIYDIKKQRLQSVEALARLNVPDYGYISPEEFIRIAEQNGIIVQVGMLVLEEVCRFIKDEDLKSMGVEYAEVNLSVIQCMQEKLSQSIKEVMDKYDVEPDMINLEITESAAAYSEERLVNNMKAISGMGILFSLDDYGSGYSNINYIVDLPFSYVKIDKYVVWAAMRDDTSRKILESTIKMFKSINLKVIAEGVEDEKMVGMLIDMGADYLQGFYYSRPVPEQQLLDILKKNADDTEICQSGDGSNG